jgi:hypothetical protein
MARIVEFRSSDEPYISMSEALDQHLGEPLVYRDLDGVLADIPAVCCRRCGEVTVRSHLLGNHLCMTPERTERLREQGMQVFRRIVAATAPRWPAGRDEMVGECEQTINGILSDLCDMEQEDPDHPDALVVHYDTLRHILERWVTHGGIEPALAGGEGK